MKISAKIKSKSTKAFRHLQSKIFRLHKIYKPTSITSISEVTGIKKIEVLPAYESSFFIPESLKSHISSFYRYNSQHLIPASNVYVLPNGRVDTDRSLSVAVIDNQNQVLTEPSCQFGKHGITPIEENNIFTRKFYIPPKFFDKTVFSMVSGGGANANYYHWLFDVLPRLYLLQKSGIYDQVDLFFVPNYSYHFQKETLKKLGIGKDMIIDSSQYQHIKADTLICTNHPNNQRVLPLWICKFLKEAFLKPIAEHKKKWIYISRKDALQRRILNEIHLIEELQKLGIQEYQLGKLSFEAQVELFSQAELIVSPHGAGLANLVFCQQGSSVIELFAHGHVTPLYSLLSNHTGLYHDFMICSNNTNNISSTPFQAQKEDIIVDIEQLIRKIEIQLERLQTSRPIP